MSKVFFCYESKFNLFGSYGKKYVRWTVNEWLLSKCTKNTVKFGGGSVSLQHVLVALQTRVNAACIKICCKTVLYPSYRILVMSMLSLSRIMPPAIRQGQSWFPRGKLYFFVMDRLDKSRIWTLCKTSSRG